MARTGYVTIKKLLEREREIFYEYIRHHGRIVDLQFLCDKYTQEDMGRPFSLRVLYNHLNNYVAGNFITEEEKQLYKNVNRIPKSLALKRGEELVDTFLKNFDYHEVAKFRDIYAKQDGKINHYKPELLEKYISYFLTNTTDREKADAYKWHVCASKHNLKGRYQLQDIRNLLKMTELKDQLAYLDEKGINRNTLHNMINIACTIDEDIRNNRGKLDELVMHLSRLNNVSPQPSPTTTRQSHYEQYAMRQNDAKELLEGYLQQDDVDIVDWIFKKSQKSYKSLSTFWTYYQEQYPELKPLIDQAMEKHQAYLDRHIEDIACFKKMLDEGIMKNGRLVRPTAYDYYQVVNLPPKKAIEIIFKQSSKSFFDPVKNFIEAQVLGRIYSSKEELIEKVNFISDSKEATEEDKEAAADYIIFRHWPLCDSLYIAILKEHLLNNLDLHSHISL